MTDVTRQTVTHSLRRHCDSLSRHCERSEAIQAQAVPPGRLSGRRLCLDCFVPRNDGDRRMFSSGYAAGFEYNIEYS
ncbi:MAG: hypothetical protein LBJ47_06065 [Tannerella sp.]|nr:hypothetical protein [Tannerella sp.]